MSRSSSVEARKGFTLVELAVVIVIIGVLAAFGVPRFLQSVERSKASEAFQYLAAIRSAQERYLSKEGIYADSESKLDITQTTPKYFNVGSITLTTSDAGKPGWTLELTRIAATSSYGAYTVDFTENGFDTSSKSTITTKSGINPMGT